MTATRSFLLAGLVLFFAVQQALCACAAPAGTAPQALAGAAAHDMPAGHACDEAAPPAEHDEATCPHCGTDTQLVLAAAQAVPAPVILPGPALLRPAETAGPPALRPQRRPNAAYQAHGPPKRTPLQMKTRFLN